MIRRSNIHDFYYGSSPLMKLWHVSIYALVFGAIIALMYEYQWIKNDLSASFLTQLDLCIAIIFTADYLIRLYAAPKRLVFIKDLYNIFDLIAILPSFLIFMSGAEILRAARLIRAIRALRVLRFMRIAKLLEIKMRPPLKEVQEAHAEINAYRTLVAFYHATLKGNKQPAILRNMRTLISKLNKAINTQNKVNATSLFTTTYYELARQTLPAITTLQHQPNNILEQRKLRAILIEMGDLLINDAGMARTERLEERVGNRLAYLLLLVRGSVNTIVITASVAICINLFVRMMEWDHILAPALEYLSVIEGVLGTLIALITSVNLRFAIEKRERMDNAVMTSMNFLTFYSTRIRTLLDNFEPNDKARTAVATELKHHFDSIGHSLIHCSQSRNTQEVRFDTSIMQRLERIRFVIKPYKEQLDTRTYDKYEEMHGFAAQHLNQLQQEVTTSLPTLFNELNHWLIRITYFCLLALSPLNAIPRILLMNLLQRMFYRVAQETDDAILESSLARLPLERRVIRRLNRMSAIFGY